MPEMGIKIKYVYVSIVNHSVPGRHVTCPPWALGITSSGCSPAEPEPEHEFSPGRDAGYPATSAVSGTMIGTGGPRV